MSGLHLDSIDSKLVIGSFLLFISIMGSKLSVKMGVPILIFFIAVGIGTKVLLNLDLEQGDNANFLKEVAKMLGVITLTFILFSGGLETDQKHIYSVWRSGIMLSTLGALSTALLVGCFLYQFSGDLELTLATSMLIGAIVASTDAAAVFSILRSNKICLKANIGPLLELESGSNDVMVYFLMTFLLRLINEPSAHLINAIPVFFFEMIIGAIGGLCAGNAMAWILNKINLNHQGLYSPLTIAMVFLTSSIVNTCHGSGYLAVYLAGIILGNRDFMRRKSIVKFYEGFGWLLQIGMFIALGLLVKIKILLEMIPLGIILSLMLMLIARPISVFISLFSSTFTRKHKLFISWVGLRGAVPIVFATYLYGNDGLPSQVLADKIFHLIFFVVLISVLVQGSTLYPLAERWNLKEVRKRAKRQHNAILEVEDIKKMFIQLEIPVGSSAHEKQIVDLGFPKECFIVLVYRNKRYFPVSGGTTLYAHDKLFVVVDTKKELKEINACLGIT